MFTEKIESISSFNSAWEVMEAYVSVNRLSDLTREEREAMQTFDSLESYSYYVINNHVVIVCDSITGDVINKAAINNFFVSTLRYVIEAVI